MFYNLDHPVGVEKQILAEDGIRHFEQSDMPSMRRLNSCNTICHEHSENYSLGVVKRILDAAGL